MIQTKEVDINGKPFMITQFTAREGLKLQLRLIRQVGPIVGSIATSLEELGKLTPMAIARALSQKIEEDACYNLIMDLIATTKYKNRDLKPAEFDMVFAGDYKTLFELLYFIIDFNFGNFFGADGIGSLLNNTDPATTEESSTKSA